jgi:hypothetical protein
MRYVEPTTKKLIVGPISVQNAPTWADENIVSLIKQSYLVQVSHMPDKSIVLGLEKTKFDRLSEFGLISEPGTRVFLNYNKSEKELKNFKFVSLPDKMTSSTIAEIETTGTYDPTIQTFFQCRRIYETFLMIVRAENAKRLAEVKD